MGPQRNLTLLISEGIYFMLEGTLFPKKLLVREYQNAGFKVSSAGPLLEKNYSSQLVYF